MLTVSRFPTDRPANHPGRTLQRILLGGPAPALLRMLFPPLAGASAGISGDYSTLLQSLMVSFDGHLRSSGIGGALCDEIKPRQRHPSLGRLDGGLQSIGQLQQLLVVQVVQRRPSDIEFSRQQASH